MSNPTMNFNDCWYKDVCNYAPQGCKNTCIRFAEMLQLVKLSNIPQYLWKPPQLIPGKDLKVFSELARIKLDISNFVTEGNNLYLYSKGFGNGKTTWAIKLMLAYFNQVWCGNAFRCRGIFISVPEFFDRERQLINNRDNEFIRIRDNLLTCDLVIWDDVSSVKMTDYSSSLFLNFLDARILSKKSNIFTSNLNYAELIEHCGGRLSSRIWNTSKIIQFIDSDKRGVRSW